MTTNENSAAAPLREASEQSTDTPSETMDWRRIANLLGEHVKSTARHQGTAQMTEPTNTAAAKAGDFKCPKCGWLARIDGGCAVCTPPAEPASAAESADIVHDDAGKAWALAPINGTTWDMRNEGRELLIDHDCKADRLDELADTIYRAMIGVRPPFKPDPAQPADTPSDTAPDGEAFDYRPHLTEIAKILASHGYHPAAGTLRRLRDDLASRPQPARGEVSEAEIEAAEVSFVETAPKYTHQHDCHPHDIGEPFHFSVPDTSRVRVALEAAARVRATSSGAP